MTRQTLVDNDVLIKGSAYSLWHLLSAPVLRSMGVLGAARFVVPDAIRNHGRIKDRDRATAAWRGLLAVVEELEPTSDELDVATALEEVANAVGLPLDVGESQLCAIAIHRAGVVVLTGDKRAIAAAEQLRSLVARLEELDGRVACFEQLLHALSSVFGMNAIRGCVCSESAVDRALSICCSCFSEQDIGEVDESGLLSYIDHLRAAAPNLLAPFF